MKRANIAVAAALAIAASAIGATASTTYQATSAIGAGATHTVWFSGGMGAYGTSFSFVNNSGVFATDGV